MVLRMAECGEDFQMLFTPTGRELPDLVEHMHFVKCMTGKSLVIRQSKMDLDHLILEFDALPNNRQRWCTRMLKIEVCQAYLLENPGSTLCVGLRADEEGREGMFGSYAQYRYPLREYGWGLPQVVTYCQARGVQVPARTDCDYCYDQRLIEWWRLWKNHPDRWAHAEALEAATGHTFRSATRDTWPAALKDLRFRFQQGDFPKRSLTMSENAAQKCRACSL